MISGSGSTEHIMRDLMLLKNRRDLTPSKLIVCGHSGGVTVNGIGNIDTAKNLREGDIMGFLNLQKS